MKVKLLLIGALLVLVLAAFFDSPTTNSGRTLYYEFTDQEAVDADAQPIKLSKTFSFEYILDDMNEVNGNIVETYREYEVYKDSDGNIISRIPTINLHYLTYVKE